MSLCCSYCQTTYRCPLVCKDRLSSDEILTLTLCVNEGRLGNGLYRKQLLGDWYSVVQAMVNYAKLKKLF